MAKKLYGNGINAAPTKTVYYTGLLQYSQDGTTQGLDFIMHKEGRATPDGTGNYNLEFQIKDHLGNLRLVFTDANGNGTIENNPTEVIQQANYYPFGLDHLYAMGSAPAQTGPMNKYKYNGKELQDEYGLDWSDYGARFYDAQIGRWHVVDPLAETYSSWSPYHYAMNNPIRYTDVFGMGAGDFHSQNGKYLGTDGIDDDKVYIVTDKQEQKEIKATDKEGGTTQSSDVSSAVETTKTELQESLDVPDRTVSNGGFAEETSVVTPEGEITRGETGKKSDGGVASAKLPYVEGEDNTSIHSHPTETTETTGWSALRPGPDDPKAFEGYNRNIIVGALGAQKQTQMAMIYHDLMERHSLVEILLQYLSQKLYFLEKQ